MEIEWAGTYYFRVVKNFFMKSSKYNCVDNFFQRINVNFPSDLFKNDLRKFGILFYYKNTKSVFTFVYFFFFFLKNFEGIAC